MVRPSLKKVVATVVRKDNATENTDTVRAGGHAYAMIEANEGEAPEPGDSFGDRYEACRSAVRTLLEDPESSRVASAVHTFIVILIAVSTSLAVMQTVKEFAETFKRELDLMEMAFTSFFSLEILARLWTSKGYCLSYCRSPSNLVDVLCTMPWYLEKGVTLAEGEGGGGIHKLAGSMATLRMVRLVRTVRILRVLRVAKAARHSETISVVIESIGDSLDGIFVLVFLIGMACVATAAMMYAVEFEEESGKFASVPQSMWWSLTTITTVGYGDVVPATPLGKLVASLAMVVGLISVSVSVATITTSFTESYNKRVALTKVAKSLKKAQTARLGDSIDLEGSGDDRSVAMAARSGQSQLPVVSDGGGQDLVSSLLKLESETKQILTRIEFAHHQSSLAGQPVVRAQTTGARSSPLSSRSGTGTVWATLALQELQDQSATFFKSAMRYVELLTDAEQQTQMLSRAPSED